MITKKTVFILGAGASSDFGYLQGKALREKICERLKINNKYVEQIASAFSNWQNEIDDYKIAVVKFAEDLYHNGAYSIDDFLERFQNKYLEIGKMAIAQVLVECENHSALFDKDNWYRFLCNKIKQETNGSTFLQNRISFISFNYDRSLEHYLYKTLLAFDEKATETWAINTIRNIPIIHLYGRLDPLPWEDAENGRTYGKGYTLAQFKAYRRTISLVFEKIMENIEANFEQAFRLLNDAERIYILGFGFHPENISRLRLAELVASKKRICATCWGLEDQQLRNIINRIKNIRTYQTNNMDRGHFEGLGLFPVDAYEFINKIAELD